MRYNKSIIIILLLINNCINNFNIKNQEKTSEEIIAYQNKMYEKIEKYKTRPMYLLQVNKNNCRVLVSCNDIPHWITMYENFGESMSLFLNNYILKTGDQTITLHIYPKSGQEYIAENADLDVKLKFAKDKEDGVDAYTNIINLELPGNIGEKKLPYFKLTIPFHATVPFDFSENLKTAQDLSKIRDINNTIIKKYEKMRKYLVKGDGLSFLKEMENSYLKSCSHLYATKQELLESDKNDNTDIKIANLNVKNRKVYSIENYEINFFCENKLVLLRNKNSKKEMLGVEFETENGIDGHEVCVILYLPKDSNELKVW
jgi:hypothetical protein